MMGFLEYCYEYWERYYFLDDGELYDGNNYYCYFRINLRVDDVL